MTIQNIIIYHNNKCSKSRIALNYLIDNNYKFKIVEYLKNKPKIEELNNLINMLNVDLNEVIRINEKEFKELNIKINDINNEEAGKILFNNIKLLQRPIIVVNNRAVIARNIEKLIEFLN